MTKEHPIDCQCGNHEAHTTPFGVIKEAIASCRLDGDTQSAEKGMLKATILIEPEPKGRARGFINKKSGRVRTRLVVNIRLQMI